MSMRLEMQQREIPAKLLQPVTVANVVSVVARSSPEWQRLRAAVGDGHAPYVDADLHTDNVWATVYGPRRIVR